MFLRFLFMQKPNLDYWDKSIKNEIEKACIACVQDSMATVYQEMYYRTQAYFDNMAQRIYRKVGPLKQFLKHYNVTFEECLRYTNCRDVASAEQLMKLPRRCKNKALQEIFEKVKFDFKMETEYDEDLVDPSLLVTQYFGTQQQAHTLGMGLTETDDEEEPQQKQQTPKKSRKKRRHRPRLKEYWETSSPSEDTSLSDSSSDSSNKNVKGRKKKKKNKQEKTKREKEEKETNKNKKMKEKDQKNDHVHCHYHHHHQQ